MIDADFVEAIRDLAAKAGTPIVIPERDSRMAYLVRQPDGSYERVEGETNPVKHRAEELHTITDFANRFPERSVIWVEGDTKKNSSKVVCLIEDHPDKDRVELELPWSEPFKRLADLAANWRAKPLTQAELVRELRTTFGKCVTPDHALLSAVRSLKFKSQTEASGVIDPKGRSVGRTLAQEVTGEKQLPEEVSFTVPIYSAGHLKVVSIRCAIDVDFNVEKLHIAPLPGEIEQAILEARLSVASTITNWLDEASPARERVYFGCP
jgi:hypothetical protein